MGCTYYNGQINITLDGSEQGVYAEASLLQTNKETNYLTLEGSININLIGRQNVYLEGSLLQTTEEDHYLPLEGSMLNVYLEGCAFFLPLT